MQTHFTGWTVLAAAGSLVVGLASSASAADVYFGCAKLTNNRMRPSSILVNATPACHNGEVLRTWNQEGPQGPQGPGGFNSCSVEEIPGTAQANTFAVTNASCSSGFATGAGALWHTPFDAADNGPFYFFPRNGSLWTVVPYNHTGSVQDYRVFLQCCN
jgi:hypothetical protein